RSVMCACDVRISPFISRRQAPEFLQHLSALDYQRAQGKPGADRTHGSRATKSTGGRTTGVTGNSGFPCAMGYGLYVLSPARLGLLVTAFAKCFRILRRDTCR